VGVKKLEVQSMPAKPETKTIKQKVFIEASPEQVYDAFMYPKTHSAFTGSKASGSAKVGGTFTAWDGYITAKNVELARGKRIVQEWKTSEWPEGYPASRLELDLAKKGDGTEVSMVHSLVPASQSSEYAEGWTEWYWNPLKKFFSK